MVTFTSMLFIVCILVALSTQAQMGVSDKNIKWACGFIFGFWLLIFQQIWFKFNF